MQRTEENTEQSAEEADGGRDIFLDMEAKRCYDTDKRLNNHLIIGGNVMTRTYKIEVDCANCAAKMEEMTKKTAGVADAVVNYMTQKMTVVF